MADKLVLGLDEIDATRVAAVGGKGAHLGELARIEGVRVPPGFCVTSAAFRRILVAAPSIGERLERLSRLLPDEREAIRPLAAELRAAVEGVALPGEVESAIVVALASLGGDVACAVRSSATAEDLPTASFAGQHDTYLNVVGKAAILAHVRRCWASLFTERAVTYRLRNGFDHRQVHMAVVVERMVFAQASGIVFTADPVTSNRKILSVEASFGLGEALVDGQVNADVFKVQGGAIVARSIGTKRLAVAASPTGGTHEEPIAPERQRQPALTDAEVVRLAQLARRIEAHFGRPQDLEWCLADGEFHVVQSRPITTLFPVPARDDGDRHVYVSVGHAQMMTDAMKPLGCSLFQLTAATPMFEAGGRLFVDVTRALGAPSSRAGLLATFGRGDPLLRDTLQALVDRGDFVPSLPDAAPAAPPAGPAPAPIATDPALVAELIRRWQASVAAARHDVGAHTGAARLDAILADIQALKRLLVDRQSHQALMAGMEATWWLNEKLQAWLGEKNAADTLARSVPNNVTSEMGLALLDVADAIRPHPQVVELLRRVDGDGFLDELPRLAGGHEARDAIAGWLARYGMRCVGEIDVSRPRWSEHPATVVPMILADVDNFAPGESARRLEEGRRAAADKERELLARLRALPDGERRADETRRMIERLRTFIGYREYPKYAMIGHYFVYRQALLDEAARLVDGGVLRETEDVFYFTFAELHDVVRTRRVDDALLRRRKEAFRAHRALTPPRVLTSDGEVVAASYRRDDVPAGALVGLPVSGGTVEGRARVVRDAASAILEAGDILVTAFADPSWTPLFVAIRGLVTEVGGVMTHGAVIAREYGLPAVVGVEGAMRRIRDGDRIRVHGTEGYVEILSSPG